MRKRYKVILSAVAALSLAQTGPPARAQSPLQRFEITPLVGSVFGGDLNVTSMHLNPFDRVFVNSSISYGGIGNLALNDWAQIDVLWSRQPTSLSGHTVLTDTRARVSSATLDQVQFGILIQGGASDGPLTPFVVGGLGFMHINPGGNVVGGETKPAFNIGGGIKYFFDKHFGLRLEMRWTPAFVDADPEFSCSPTGCFIVVEPQFLHQGMVNAGFILRF